jgi:hypothetical protein
VCLSQRYQLRLVLANPAVMEDTSVDELNAVLAMLAGSIAAITSEINSRELFGSAQGYTIPSCAICGSVKRPAVMCNVPCNAGIICGSCELRFMDTHGQDSPLLCPGCRSQTRRVPQGFALPYYPL